MIKFEQIPNDQRLVYADDEQRRELEKLPYFKRFKAKITPKPIHFKTLLEIFDEKLRKSSMVMIFYKKNCIKVCFF